MRKETINRLLSAVASFALLANSLVYPFAVAHAQEITPTPEPTPVETLAPEITPAPEATATPTVTPETTSSPEADQPLAETPSPSLWTFEKVELNKEYQNGGVTLTFTKLPNPAGNIKIEEITLTQEQIQQTGSLSDKAYDITSDMKDGDFSYNLSLPIPESSKGKAVEVKFAEELSNIGSAEKVENTLTKTDTSVSVTNLDHFTIFVVTNPSPPPTNQIGNIFDNDNGSSVYLETGTGWGNVTGTCKTNSVNGNARRLLNTSSGTATFAFNVPTTGNYNVYAIWTYNTGRATNATYTINYEGGSSGAITKDQRTGTVCNLSDYQLLGTYSFNGGGSYSVVLSNVGADGTVVADAIKILSVDDPVTVYVDDGWSGTSVGSPVTVGSDTYYMGFNAFSKIQDAIGGVASGGTVNVAAGTYAEQVTIDKSLDLIGDGETTTTILAPNTISSTFTNGAGEQMKPVVTIIGVSVNISQLKIDGVGKGNANNQFVGIGLYNAGGSIDHVTITNIRETPLSGVQGGGDAIYAYNADGSLRTLDISNSTISNYQKNGMTLKGAGLSVDVSVNTVTGEGPTSVIGQNGIQVSDGATGTITNNQVSGHVYTGVDWWAAGILVYRSNNISISNNTLSADQADIYIAQGSNNTVGDNTITGNSFSQAGVMVSDRGDASHPATDNTINHNTITGGFTGIWTSYTSGNTYSNNIISNATGNGIYSWDSDNNTFSGNNISGIAPDSGGWGIALDGGDTASSTIGSDNNTVSGNTIQTSAVGLWVGNGSDDNTFTNNILSGNHTGAQIDKYPDYGGANTAPTGLQFHTNSFTGNTQGFINNTTVVTDATNNWWGSATGPSDVGYGTGDKVSTNVNYKPWCTNLACTTFSSDNPTTTVATVVTSTTATLNGIVGTSTADNTSFWYGTTSAGPFTSAVDPSSQVQAGWFTPPVTGTQSAGASFSDPLTGLTPGTPYHFVAWSLVGGIWYPGAILNFTTADKYTQAEFKAFDGVNIGTNSYTESSDITVTYIEGTGSESNPVKLTLTGYAPIVTPWFDSSWTTYNYVTIGIKLPAGFSGTSVYDAGVMRYNVNPSGIYAMGTGSTDLAIAGAAVGYLDYSFAANSINTKKDGLVKLQVIWNVGDAPEYFTINITGLQLAPNVPTATLTANGVNIATNGYTNSETFTFNLSSADATRYQMKYWNDIAGSSYKESTPWNPTTLSAVYPDSFTQGEGTHYFAFSACNAGNAADNCSTYSPSFIVTYDKTAPSDPGTPSTTPNPTNNVLQNWLWLSSTDIGGSGVKGYWQNVYDVLTSGSSAWSWIGNVLGVSTGLTDGEWQLQLQAEDNVGNKSGVVASATTTIDTIAPTITIVNPDTTPAQSKTITASAFDGTLSMSNTTGSVCDETLSFVPYTSQTFISESDNGKKVCYKAIDVASNTTYLMSNAIAGIDTTGPTTPGQIGWSSENPLTGSDYASGTEFDNYKTCGQSLNYSPITNLWGPSTDANAGVAGYDREVYSPNSTTLIASSSLSTNYVNGGGATNGNTYWTRIRAYDTLGNKGAWTALCAITYDVTAPTATISYSTTSPTNTDVLATLNPSESVTVTNNGGATTYNFSSNGSFIFNFSDVAGNTGSATATVTNIDKTAPPTPTHASPADNSYLTTANWTLADWSDETDLNGPVTYIYESSTTNITNSVGAFTSPAYISGALLSSQISTGGTPAGIYFWHVRSQDAVGNKSEWSVPWKVTVDNTAPTTPTATPVTGDYMSDQSVTLVSFDSGSGLKNIYYTLDGTTPDNSKTLYLGAITVDKDMTIKAIAYDNADNASGILEAVYGIAPVISGETSSSVSETTATITWTTDDLSTSRVIYDTVSHAILGAAPNYGYANSTIEDSTKVTSHSVGLTGLTAGTTYYYRTVSHGSPEAVSSEKTFATTAVTTNTTITNNDSAGAGDGLGCATHDCSIHPSALLAQVLGTNTWPKLAYSGGNNTDNNVLGADTEVTNTPEPTSSPTLSPEVTPGILGSTTEENKNNYWWWLLLLLPFPLYFGGRLIFKKK